MLNINNQSKKKKFRPHFEAIHLKFTNIFVSVTDDKYRVSHSKVTLVRILVKEVLYVFQRNPIFFLPHQFF